MCLFWLLWFLVCLSTLPTNGKVTPRTAVSVEKKCSHLFIIFCSQFVVYLTFSSVPLSQLDIM